ncbi:Hsp33 family molecular chaperone HslO [Geomicrobium sp. JSM 1781026]|uniref:Hsp33 family molecular chaperone HslO n=1 Tax=Geomicrobium sp. JSM 1781026 TaxID=3344580 RepID=UPI0035C11F43
MQNRIIKALIFNKQVRLYLINNTSLLNEILHMNQNANTIIKEALASSISIMSILSATLKGNQRLSAALSFDHPKSKIFVDTDAHGNVRGYANDFLLSSSKNYSTVKELIGLKGSIRMIKANDFNQFTGITDMPYQDLDRDFSHYFKQSDQTETLIKTTIHWQGNKEIKNSYGIYAQLLPQSPTHLLNKVEEHFQSIQCVLNEPKTLINSEIFSLLNQYFDEAEIIGESNVQFFCGCSKEMFFGLLHSVDAAELKGYLHSRDPIISTCNRCGRNYSFNEEEIKLILGELNG